MNNKGFTIVDVIVATAIIGILTVLIYPTISDFLMLKKEGEEQQQQQQILRMIKAMSHGDQKLTVSNDVNDFALDVRAFGDVPLSDIVQDSFGYARYYRGVSTTEVFRDGSIDIHYAFLYSTGPDACWGDGVDCAPADILANVNALLGNVPANYSANYSAIAVPEGDYLIRYTDFEGKLKSYNETVDRLNTVVTALSEYGRLKYYEGVAEGISDTMIFYPPSDGPAMALIYDNVEAETSDETTEGDIYGGGGSDVILNDDADADDKMDRRLGMIALTRILGLPDKYCCSAMKRFVFTDGEEYEEGFFYYSNPLPRIDPGAGVCGAEALTVDDRKLPPRITVDEDPCGK